MFKHLFKGEAKQVHKALANPVTWVLWGIIVAWVWWLGAPLISAVLGILLVLLAMIDLTTFTLPRLLTWPMIATGLVGWYLYGGLPGAEFSLQGGVLGALAFWLLRQFSLRVLNRDGLGRGDITLFGAIGTWVGPLGLPLVALVGSLLALTYLLIQRPGWGVRIPFGPYLCAAAWIVWLYQGALWRLLAV